jgi:hypothetical protein
MKYNEKRMKGETTLLSTTSEQKSLKYEREARLENKLGHFMEYYFYPDGRVFSKYLRKFLTPTYRNGIPFISLSENGISYRYRLDQAVFKSYHCWYVINSKEVIHINGKQDDCSRKNLMIPE